MNSHRAFCLVGPFARDLAFVASMVNEARNGVFGWICSVLYSILLCCTVLDPLLLLVLYNTGTART